MPKLKKPSSLVDMARNVLLDYLVQCCDEHSAEDSLEKLRHCAAFIKETVCACIPRAFLTDFLNDFLDKFDGEIRPASHNRAVLEIIMDSGIVEIRCRSTILTALNPSDARRFHGLKQLTLDIYSNPEAVNLENFCLTGLTELILIMNCTDNDLEIIGSNCRKLRALTVLVSEITDDGLRALSSCSELRYFYTAACQRISLSGIHELLSMHKKMEKLLAFPFSEIGFGDSSKLQLDLSVYPSISCFGIELNLVTSEDLRSIVAKFPNLTTLVISRHIAADLRILKSLRKLSELNFTGACHLDWNNLRQLLALIGAEISVLKACPINPSCCATQNDLNFVFKHCGDISTLEFNYGRDLVGQKLVVPPFRNLKVLSCRFYVESNEHDIELEFGEMLKLETLEINKFYLSTKLVKSFILDNVKFPNLKEINIPDVSDVSDHCEINRLREIARNHNLDVEIQSL